MITQAENEKRLLHISWFEQAHDFLHAPQPHSLTLSTQKAVNTITTATDSAINAVSATIKDSLEQTLQKVNDVNTATSNAMQTAVNNSVNEWLQAHPVGLRVVQILVWGTNHPIISIILLLFAIALLLNIIKIIGRFIDKLATLLLQAPLKLLQKLFTFIVSRLGNLKIFTLNLPAEKLATQQSATIIKDKSQQIAEIFTRLEALQQEQNELLNALMEILASEDRRKIYD